MPIEILAPSYPREAGTSLRTGETILSIIQPLAKPFAKAVNLIHESIGQPIIVYNGDTSTVRSVAVPTIGEKMKILDDIAQLKENWNGNDAVPFSEEHIKLCEDMLLRLVDPLPEIFPTACGSIQYEYEHDNGSYLEFEIFKDGKVEFFNKAYGGAVREGCFSYPDDIVQINEEIRHFHG